MTFYIQLCSKKLYLCAVRNSNFFKFILLPGQFLSLHALFKFSGHSLPLFFAYIKIVLFCVPGPHVWLQVDHFDITQSTETSFVNSIAQQMLPSPGHLASLAELINNSKISSDALKGWRLSLILLSSHKSCWIQLNSEKKYIFNLKLIKKILGYM